ncbi:saccharopine dehydrogenase NADP-binding domain-containing protein [Nocardia bhagyanarayanae]|uniref:Saccharopine dehydrogenase-like protein n=1 Tax=Nocardia bhagyanarayanae TaxID=1215925 RepID=A0A543F686_9NOCA|nr:saccharopine dehydrogenase NADP-binding domain-containing protein [Nocardia bhagyanarayanae]TQM29352.1 saccharopine dehydrogenase-like protein [Nocardia bhagyanarayanae]
MTVVILGGYGAVGREAAAVLVAAGRRVRLVGRRPERARAVDGAEMVRADIADDGQLAGVLDDASVVLMCAELDNARVARACFERGVHYLDVSASHPLLCEIQELDALARAHDAVGVLSAGLIPGVSNLLAAAVLAASGQGAVRIGAVLGSGEAHGPAAVRWTLDGLGAVEGSWRMVFPDGRRTVHRFPFSDQYTLPHTLGTTDARTGLALDSRLFTALIGAARRPFLARLMRGRAAEWLLTRVHLGSERFAVVAESGDASAWVAGSRQSRATGVVAALLTQRVASFPPGVRHIEQLVEPAEFLAELRAYGFESHV